MTDGSKTKKTSLESNEESTGAEVHAAKHESTHATSTINERKSGRTRCTDP